MVRVLQVVTHMNRGGLETMLMNFYRNMDRERVQFDFLTHRPYDGDYGAEIQQMGGKLYHLPVLNPFSSSYKHALSRFFEEHPEYRIIHVHQDCLSSIILKAAKEHGIPVRIAHSHNSNQDKNLKYLIKLYYRGKIPRYATDLFACSQQAGTWMFQRAAFRILNNAIDTSLYEYHCAQKGRIREALGIPRDCLVLGHIGRFSPQKNHTFLLDIFAKFMEQGADAVLLLAGDGELKTQMEKKAKDLGLSQRIIFTGIRSDIPDLLQAMDVFVFPSLYEGLPVTLVEAQTSGLPCLISDVIPADAAILPDLITTQSLSDPAEQWAQALCDLASQQGSRRSRVKEMTEKGFDVQETAKWLEDFYLENAGT